MGRVIAVANQKGGVGKTTTAINLSACLAEKGQKVLAIDMDPQGNMTSGLGIDKDEVEKNIYDLMIGQAGVDEVLQKEAIENLDVIPTSIDLSAAEIELIGVDDKEFIIRNAVQPIKDDYDYIIIDCPPSLSMLTINAMTTADSVLVPIQCEYYALEGLSQLIHTVELVKERLNPVLEIEGVVFTMYDARTNLSLQVVENVKENLQQNIYKTIIPRNIRLAEAPSYGMPINLYDPKSTGASAYQRRMPIKKKGLGKGLDSLIPDNKSMKSVTSEKTVESKEDAAAKSGVQVMKINEVEPNRDQPRKNFDEDALLELSDSIKQFGVLQPLLVRKRKDYYEIIAGERRWRAAKLAGVKEVPVIEKEYTDQEILEIGLIENIQRENLNPIEEAIAYKRLLEEFNLKQDEVAERVSKSRTAVTNSMRLLKLSDKVQQMIIDDMISTGHARALLAIDDPELQYTLANKIFDEKLSVRETEKLVKEIKNPKKPKEKKPVANSFIYQDLEEKMKSVFGTKVSIASKGKGKGKIEIEYYSDDELEHLFDMMMSIKRGE